MCRAERSGRSPFDPLNLTGVMPAQGGKNSLPFGAAVFIVLGGYAVVEKTEISVQINGELRTVPAGLTIDGLLLHLGLKPGHVAIEINGDIVPRSQHAACPVPPDARLEIVHFVGGG